MLSTVAGAHPVTVGLLLEWLLAMAAAVVGAVMVMVGMIEELPMIIRSTANRLFKKTRA